MFTFLSIFALEAVSSYISLTNDCMDFFFYKVSSSACAIRVCICLIIDYETRIEVLKKNNTGTIKTRQHRSQHAKQRVFQRIDNGGKCNGEFTSCTRGRLLNVLWCRNILFNVNFKSCFLNNKKYTRKRLKKEEEKKGKEEAFVCTHVKVNYSPLNLNVMYDIYNPNNMYCIHK